MIRTALLFPIRFIGLLAFLYTVGGGWLVLPPGALIGAF